MDSNGDGIGDLGGIRQKLDYLQWLGVDAIWISPIFPSPMADFGYDVSNYTDIDPMFGTLSDFDELVAQAHGRAIKVVLDYVPNHTSDQHPWFRESRESKTSARRDWYIWRNPEVQAAMHAAMRFWFERGVDGFRIDALRQVMKHVDLPDNPPDPTWRSGQDPYRSLLLTYSADQPELMSVVHGFRDIAEEY